jgi:tetratricopeptide (TPR) repeat protein
MRKYIILVLLIVPLFNYAQDKQYNQKVDSITYKYYLNSDWNNLIIKAKEAIKDSIDFKFLRQRLAYAYFAKGDYTSSQEQYEKALKFDEKDIDTRTYLYYCGLYGGNESFTRYHAGELTSELKKVLKIKPFRILNSVDVEYNYKSNNNGKRGNPAYIRGGIDSQFGYRLNLYQAFSTYGQTNMSSFEEPSGLLQLQIKDSTAIKQFEYFALLGWTITPHLNFDIGYHNVNSKLKIKNTYAISSINYKEIFDTIVNLPGNMFCTKLTYTLNRFDLALSGSIFNYDSTLTHQYGIHAGISLPGKHKIYLKSSLYGMIDSNANNRLIFNQSAGVLFFKKLWIEGNITLGNLDNYTDNNGLYIYNSQDPTVFRSGFSLFWSVLPKISLFGNYTYDTKLIKEDLTNYNQHSFSGGIIWKL